MRITTYVHGILDYSVAIVLFFAPTIFGFSEYGGAAVWLPKILAILVLLQSLMTNYELGMIKVLPMKVHLVIDYIAAALLAVSPWLFGFSNLPANAWVPHLVAGIGVFLVTLLTEKNPRFERAGHASISS